MINSGKLNAFIINNSSNAYYVRFSGIISGTQANIFTVASDYNYYIGIIRPQQILPVPMSSAGVIDVKVIEPSGLYSSATLTGWNETAINKMNEYFAIVLPQT